MQPWQEFLGQAVQKIRSILFVAREQFRHFRNAFVQQCLPILGVQVRIAATQRAYAALEQDRLLDVFGEPARWGQTLKSLLWTMTSVQVPGFRGQTVVMSQNEIHASVRLRTLGQV